MAQSTISRNDLFVPDFGGACLTGRKTIAASQGELAAGTIMVLNPATNKFVKWDSTSLAVVTASGTPDTTATIDTTKNTGVCVLLEAVDATSETTGLMGFQGQIDADKVVLGGSIITTVTETVKAVLRLNGIHVRGGTSALAVAGA